MKFCLDRLEGRIAVCLCEDEHAPHRQYDVPADDLPSLAPGDIFEAQVDETGRFFGVVLLKEETDARRASAESRLQALFARKKNKG